MSKTERRRKNSRHSDSSSRRDSLSSLQNDKANTKPADLVRRLEDQVRREFITRQRQVELNAKLQDEYDQLRKRLAEAETYIDQLRLGASVKFDKKFVFTYEHDPMDTSARPTVSEGTSTSNRRRRLSNGTDTETSSLSSSARARRAREESKLMAHLFEVRDLEEQMMALKQQLEATAVTSNNDERLKELYSVVKALEEHQQKLSEAMAAANTDEEQLDHKQAQDQSLVADELSRVTGELQQLQQMIAQYSSHTPSQQEASLDERKQESPLSSEIVELTSAATTANHVLVSEMVGDTLHSSVPEEYLVQTGTAMSSQSHDPDDSKYCTSVTSTLSSVSLDNQSVQKRSVSSHGSPTSQISVATNVDGEDDATPTEDCAGGSEWSETSTPSSPLPCSEQTPLIEQRALVSSTSDDSNDNNDAISQPHPPSNDQSTSNRSQQASRIPVLAKRLQQEPSSDAGNDDSTAIPVYKSSRKPVNFDDLTLNSAHQQQPMLSRIPVLNPSMSLPSSYYSPPSPYNTTGVARRAGVGGRYPSPHTASKFSHFVANESDAPSPGKAGRETLPRDDRDLNSSSISVGDDKKQDYHHPPPITSDDGGIKALQDELKSLRQLLEQQQQQQKPVGFDPSSFQFPFWQPGQFPFSSPVHHPSSPPHENSMPSAHEGSAVPTHKDSVASNGRKLVPSTHEGSDEHSESESVTTVSDTSGSQGTTSSHGNHHNTSAPASEPSSAKLRPLMSKVAMDTTTQQQHAQPVITGDTNNKSAKKLHPKKKTNKTTSHKNGKHHKKFSKPSPEVQQSDQSDSSISLLTSSDTSTLSVFNSSRLSPNQLGGYQRDDSGATETVRVPSNANLSTWVCPLCGGRSIIVDGSGIRQHHHQQPERAKTRSRSTQCDSTSYRHISQSPRHSRYDRVLDAKDDNLSKPLYNPTDRSSGLHYSSDVPSNRSSGLHYGSDVPDNRSSGLHNNRDVLRSNRSGGLHYSSDVPDNRSSGLHNNRDRSSGLHRDGDMFSNRSSRLHPNGDMFSNRNSGLHHGYNPPVQASDLHYSSDTPQFRSSGLHYKNKTPGTRNSSVLHYNSDTPVVRSTGTQYSGRNRYHRKPQRRNLHSFNGNAVTFTHPKATSTPVVIQSTQTHNYSSDSSDDICTSPITHQPTDYIVLDSVPRRRRYHVRSHVPRRHGDKYLTTSSNEDEPYHHTASRSRQLHSTPITTEATCHTAHVNLDEACRLARQLKRRSEKMYSNLSMELSVH